MGCCDGRSDIRCQRKQSLLIRQLKQTVDEKVGSEKRLLHQPVRCHCVMAVFSIEIPVSH